MTVLLTVSETWNGSDYADALEGGGTGVDLLQCVSSQYSPISSQVANTGAKTVFLRHNALIDPITAVKTYIQEFGVGTGFTYGGANSAAADYTKVLNMGNADGMTGAEGNNITGLGNGLHVEMQWDVSTANQFLGSRTGTQKFIYGDNGGAASGDARNLASAFSIAAIAMSNAQNTGTEIAPSSPVAGSIGRDYTVDAAEAALLGDRAHLRYRFYLRSDEVDGGVLQFEVVFAYSFTA
jgi:hypothetical protein